MARPGAIAVIDERHVAVAEIGTGKLLALDASRPDAREVLAEGLEQPMGLVRRGSEWFVSESAAGRVSALGANGTRRVVVEDLQQPEGLAFMPDGRLVVAEAGTGRVLLVDTPTGERETIARRLPFGIADAPGAPPGIIPTGVAVDAAGTVFISSDRESSVLRLRATGKSAP
jgi:DNA-binding beta-propeller fold protein YncE